ncbi:RNA-binding protein 48-like [Paramacrobiotus metropolitanus]|uniref:RNA-binding protein 48-like n=1 Tax=Paramacrobiotus metropolitanus TaxID=2943436 RepID=UPI0024455FEC|nr:RNA-binding protein 48-like [Paramacrobiotus metropolitanus]XP_055341565.1 RNA-binding protein 48-like [Paramacrobiotus metropolitanus]
MNPFPAADDETVSIAPAAHHQRANICSTRLPYRDGHRSTAVKVFSVCDESVYLLIHHVPALQLQEELRALCLQYGQLLQHRVLTDYPHQQFMEVHLVQFASFSSARLAKRKLDDYNFHGSILHVHYAPELESPEETVTKLEARRKEVAYRLWRNQKDLREMTNRKKRKWDAFQAETESPGEASAPASKPQYGPRLNPF